MLMVCDQLFVELGLELMNVDLNVLKSDLM